MNLPKIITAKEATLLERPKPERAPSATPEEAEQQAITFLTNADKVLREHYRGVAIALSTAGLSNAALKACEEHLRRAGWQTKRTKDGEEWLLKLERGDDSGTDFQ